MYKSLLLLFCFLFFHSSSVLGTTYYVKADGGAKTSGLSDAEAWNFATLNSKRLSPGDVVLFRRGDTFFGPLNVKGGRASGIITYSAYGSGANPVITGLTTITGWTRHSGSIYVADLGAYKLSTLNLVLLNGSVKGMGRYPNSGYLPYTGHTTSQRITGAAIGALPFDASGGEAVVRKVRWILDRHPVASHSGTALSLGNSSPHGGTLSYEAVDQNGFFIQSHLRTLDQEGEWYYDVSAKRLYMVLSNPSSAVSIAAVERLVYISSKGHISFTDIDFTGSNMHGISLHGASGVSFSGCRFSQHGQTAIYGNNVSNLTLTGGSIADCLNNGIWVEAGGYNVKVEDLTVTNIGTIAGAGRSGDGAQQGIAIAGNTTTVTNCIVKNIGYNGIKFSGSNVRIERNYVDRFCTVKDDGGGIYTFENEGVTVANRVVRNNVVLNAVGAYAGSERYTYEAHGKAAGVYLDGYSNHTDVSDNVLAHGEWAGVFVNNNSHNAIRNNLIFNHAAAVTLTASKAGTIRNMTITGNRFVARTASQETLYIRIFGADSPAAMGSFDDNIYARPIDDEKTLRCDFFQPGGAGTQRYTLAQWKSQFRLDLSSDRSPLRFSGRIDDSLRFEYNAGNEAKTVSLNGGYVDVSGGHHAGTLTLQPFTGLVLLREKTTSAEGEKKGQVITFPAVADKKRGDAPFPLQAVASSGLPVVYRVLSGPATISGNMVTLAGPGTVVLQAAQPGNKDFGPAAPVTVQFSVQAGGGAKTAQTINFPTQPYRTYGDEPFLLNAGSSSGLPVDYRVVTGPATVTGNRMAIAGVGKVTVEASQQGNEAFLAAKPVQRSFTVGKAPQVITFPSIEDRAFGPAAFALNATSSAGLPVQYRVVAGPARVSGNMVTVTGAGAVTIEAMQEGNALYNEAWAPRRSFVVMQAASPLLSAAAPATKASVPELVKSGVAVYPNPVVGSATVRVVTATTIVGTVNVVDMQGRVVQQPGRRRFEQGQPVLLSVDGSKLPAGQYLIRLSWEGGILSQPFQVSRN